MMTRKKISIVGIVLILAVIVGYRLMVKRDEKAANLIRVDRGAVTQEVRVTGKAKAAEDVDLAFEATGKIAGVYADVGTSVGAGQILAELDRADLIAQTKQAEAAIAVEQAKLNELKRGTRPEEIAIQKVKVDNAQVAVDDAVRNLGDKIEDAYTKSDDAVYNQSDQLFDNPKTNPSFKIFLTDSGLRSELANRRHDLETTMAGWRAHIASARGTEQMVALSSESASSLASVKSFLDLVGQAINSAQPSAQFSQTNLDTFRANISAARTAVNTGISNLSAANEKYRSAKSTFTLETNQLALKNAGSTPESIAAQEAALLNAAAKMQSIQASISKTILRAPINGVITKQDFRPGETAQAGAIGISLISESKLKVEANVSEVGIGSITRGNDVTVAFDAFPGEVFSGKVAYIDPASTLIDGVVNFKVTVVLEKGDPRLKSGLTANLVIRTLHKDGALRIPEYALIQRDGKTFAKKQSGKDFVEVQVVTGIHGQDGLTEVLSGLSEGDIVYNASAK